MRFYKGMAVVLFLFMLVTPLTSITKAEDKTQAQQDNEQGENSTKEESESVKVMLTASNNVVEISLKEYLVGVLAAEMMPSYHEEALKAQAVAAHTYLVKKQNDGGSDEADLTDSPQKHQGYLTKEARQKKWGGKTQAYEKKLEKAVEAVENKIITYNGKPITAAFHAMSCGQTNSAKSVWGSEVAYLKSVESLGDKLAPDYTKTIALSAEEFTEKALTLKNCELNGERKNWISELKSDKYGNVSSVKICGEKYSGKEIREAFELRSANFTIEYKSGSFYFTTNGYGHGVGLSQYGADYMARQGSKWDEIIKHYYTGVDIEDI